MAWTLNVIDTNDNVDATFKCESWSEAQKLADLVRRANEVTDGHMALNVLDAEGNDVATANRRCWDLPDEPKAMNNTAAVPRMRL